MSFKLFIVNYIYNSYLGNPYSSLENTYRIIKLIYLYTTGAIRDMEWS